MPELVHTLCPNGSIYRANFSDRCGTAASGSQGGSGPRLQWETTESRLAHSRFPSWLF